MSNGEYRAMVSRLREIVKERKLTYKDVALGLGTSEQYVKRLFASEDGHFGKLVDLCNFLKISFFEVAELANQKKYQAFSLTEAQEQQLVDNLDAFAVFEFLLNEPSLVELSKKHAPNAKRLARALKLLEKMSLIERLEGDRVKVTVHGAWNWLDHGPLSRFFYLPTTTFFFSRILELKSARKGKKDVFSTGSECLVRQETLEGFVTELGTLFESFRLRAQRDFSIFPADKLVQVKWQCGLAPCPSMVERYLEDLSKDVQ